MIYFPLTLNAANTIEVELMLEMMGKVGKNFWSGQGQ